MEATSFRKNDFWSLVGGKDPNILQQYTVQENSEYKIFLIAAYSALFTIGICGNAWVAFVIGQLLLTGTKNRGTKASLFHRNTSTLPKATNAPAPRAIQIYIFALCCCDLIVLCFLMLLILDLVYGRWIAPTSTFLCQLYLCSESLNKFCGPFFLVALSGYCYVRVCRYDACSAKTSVTPPSSTVETNEAKKLICPVFVFSRTLLKTRACLVVIGICLCLVLGLMTPVYLYGDVHFLILHNDTSIFSITPKCAFQPAENILTAFTIYSFICGYLIPASLFTFFYVSILRRAYRHAKLRLEHHRQSSAGLYSPQRPPKSYLGRVVRTVLGLVLFYLLCWSPYWAMVVWQYTIPHDEQGQTRNPGIALSYFLHILPYVNCSGYPILYTVLNKSIKDSYRNVRRKNERGSRLAFLAGQQSEQRMISSAFESASRCESRCDSLFFADLSNGFSPNKLRRNI